MQITEQITLKDLRGITDDASRAIMEIYDSDDFGVETKEDKSPVTKADYLSHNIITKGLSQLNPTIPIVSEEQSLELSTQNMAANTFWLVDPIDGTKDFINKTDQFVICIALIQDGQPVFGLMVAPALKGVYYGSKAQGSFAEINGQEPVKLPFDTPRRIVYGGSTSSSDANEQYLQEHYPDCKKETVGSQLKFAYVAVGRAVAYPRIGNTMKIWDVAAGHAIIEGAGGRVERPDGSDILYDGKDLYIGDFIAHL